MKSGATDYTRDSTRQSLLWSAPVCMGILANRIIQDANEALCSTMGYSHAELIGSSVRLLYENEQEFCRVGRTKYPIMAGKGWATIETRWRKKDGAVIDVLLTSAMFTPGDPRSGVLFVAHDISDRKSTERTLRVQNARWFDLFDNSPEGIVLLDTDPSVEYTKSDSNRGGILIIKRDTNSHFAFVRKFDRISHKIDQYLAQTTGISA